MMLHFPHFFLVEACDVFSAVFSKYYSWERQPSVHFKKYFLVLLINAEEKKIIAIFYIIFYNYVDIYGIPNTIIFKPQICISNMLV